MSEETNENTSENTNTFKFDFDKWLAEENKRKDSQKAILKKFLADMKDAGATGTIEVAFDGYGDSGECEEPSLTDEQQAIMAKLGYAFVYEEGRTWNPEKNDWEADTNDTLVRLLSCVSDVIPFDWYNNDGGYGTVRLNIDTGMVYVDGEIRVSATEACDEEF